MSREAYNKIRAERFGLNTGDNLADDLRAARQEIDRLDNAVAMLKDSRQAVYNTLTTRVARLAHVQVLIDRISAIHQADDPRSDIPYCVECDRPWPCRTAEKIRQYQ